MGAANQVVCQKLSSRSSKFIKSLRLKKYRQQENTFFVEGAKNVTQLLASPYTVQMLVGTPGFLAAHQALWQHQVKTVCQTDEATLAGLGTLTTNKAALAVAPIPTQTSEAPPRRHGAWCSMSSVILATWVPSCVLQIGTAFRPWFALQPPWILYNPKVLQASMGSFLRVQVPIRPCPPGLAAPHSPSGALLRQAITCTTHHCPAQAGS